MILNQILKNQKISIRKFVELHVSKILMPGDNLNICPVLVAGALIVRDGKSGGSYLLPPEARNLLLKSQSSPLIADWRPNIL